MRNRVERRRRRRAIQSRFPLWLYAILVVIVVLLLGVLVYYLPPVHERLSWRVANLRTQIKYALNPPEEAIFVPEGQVEAIVQATFQAMTPSSTPDLTTPTQTEAASSPMPSATPTLTPTPLPQSVVLEGVKYEHQHNRWNYCGPANISMGLTFWDWDGNRDVVGQAVKPNDKDKNVMPYEMQDFVESQGFGAVVRSGGDIETIKQLIAGGFPVVVEKGYYEYDYTGKLGWLGHYQFVNGYDDAGGVFIVQDTYIKDGENHRTSYEEFENGWRTFNYIFMVVYPPEREAEVYELLGPWADPEWANLHALEKATNDAQTLTGIDEFFAWFNAGSSHVNLLQYVDAASAYDLAFTLYANLPDDDTTRPYRVMWYQTGPYWAYYYTGRYQDTFNLANTTLIDTISEPVLEESLYWRGLAREALGDVDGAISDFRDAVRINPSFAPGLQQLNRLGVEP